MNVIHSELETRLRGLEQKNHLICQRIEQAEERSRRFESRFHAAESRYQRARRRLNTQSGLAIAIVAGAIFLSPGNRAAMAQTGLTLQQLAARVVVLETKTQYMSAGAKATTFTGCNVYIQSGSGSTSDGTHDLNGNPIVGKSLTGLGNLIIGYNAPGNA